jgi:hypothetical protein
MQLKKWFEDWNITGLKIKTPILEMDWSPKDSDKDAAWDMYIELLTRITTQPLSDTDGLEKTALESIYSIFGITRGIIKQHGRDCEGFARIAIVILNQIIRPFTARWHKLSSDGAFNDSERCKAFREELKELQAKLTNYSKMLAEIANVEDLTQMEKIE